LELEACNFSLRIKRLKKLTKSNFNKTSYRLHSLTQNQESPTLSLEVLWCFFGLTWALCIRRT